ncbi:MAG TPA: hypothetical protein VFO06_09820 [Gemmatimonadales bacterium]|nr:hypothetical protein [Gemmatimonadales bacterium]
MRLNVAAGLTLSLVILPAAVLAQNVSRTFAGTTWGESEDETKARITAAGFEFSRKDSLGDLVFDGEAMGYASRVYARQTPIGELVSVIVLLRTPDQEAIPTWRAMLHILTEKYGQPTAVLERFESPYKQGDGKAEQAILEGKGAISASWGREEEGLMRLEVTDKLAVRVAYESKDWPQESDRRTGKISSGASSGGKAKRDSAPASNPF